MRGLALAFVVVFSGCDGGEDPPPASTPPPATMPTPTPTPTPVPAGPTDCSAPPAGIFRIVQTRESGTCMPPSLAETIPGERAHPAFGRRPDGCTGTVTLNPATCEVRGSVQCPIQRNATQEGYCRLHGCGNPIQALNVAINWKPGWASGVGSIGVVISGVGGDCSASYFVTALPLK